MLVSRNRILYLQFRSELDLELNYQLPVPQPPPSDFKVPVLGTEQPPMTWLALATRAALLIFTETSLVVILAGWGFCLITVFPAGVTSLDAVYAWVNLYVLFPVNSQANKWSVLFTTVVGYVCRSKTSLSRWIFYEVTYLSRNPKQTAPSSMSGPICVPFWELQFAIILLLFFFLFIIYFSFQNERKFNLVKMDLSKIGFSLLGSWEICRRNRADHRLVLLSHLRDSVRKDNPKSLYWICLCFPVRKHIRTKFL